MEARALLNVKGQHVPQKYTHGSLCLFQHMPEDEAYFIAKEILATERTYLKDLEVITVV